MNLKQVKTMPQLLRATLLLVACVVATASIAKERIHLAAASSLRGPVDEIVQQFERDNPEYQVVVAYIASGKLVAHVSHGAPYELLISADPKYLDVLHEKRLLQGAPEPLGYGELVLWHPQLRGDITTLLERARKVAVAQPKHAPYGKAAMDYLATQSIAIRNKLVFGENVAHTAHQVHVGAAEVGFVALSQLISLDVSEEHYTRLKTAPLVPQTFALTKLAEHQPGVMLLRDALFSKQGQSVFLRFGYQLVVEDAKHVTSH